MTQLEELERINDFISFVENEIDILYDKLAYQKSRVVALLLQPTLDEIEIENRRIKVEDISIQIEVLELEKCKLQQAKKIINLTLLN